MYVIRACSVHPAICTGQDGTAPETAETTEASREENGGETLSDDEDFSE